MRQRLFLVFTLTVLGWLLWVLNQRFHAAVRRAVERYALFIFVAVGGLLAVGLVVFWYSERVQDRVLGLFEDDDESLSPPARPASWYVRDSVRREARETIDQQIAWVNGIDDKAMRTLRFNVLILGGVVSGVSILLDRGIIDGVEEVTDPFLLMGVLALVGSTSLAALTYTASSMKVGMSSNDIESVHQSDLSDEEYTHKLMTSYRRWIQQNRRTIALNSDLVTLTILLLVYGTVFTVLGILSLLPTAVGDSLIIGSTFSLALMTLVALWY
ncbi:hypothetical protein [Halolamina salifodinae]|uniref:Uncharacterized protein n=1 Tax=Halolamina salifodinae TaxID=1202767 RepID=A0A8T4GZQ9_9EURY|nr:hypothetical protein [Halolamina salifodinae]MBP1987920.1 hypothetical protein [Halolamina salifodinae]